jgi:hypothetical protein
MRYLAFPFQPNYVAFKKAWIKKKSIVLWMRYKMLQYASSDRRRDLRCAGAALAGSWTIEECYGTPVAVVLLVFRVAKSSDFR